MRRSAERGFSLLELLVALGILGLVATMLLGGVVSAGIVARQSDRDQGAMAEVAAAQIALRERIALLQPVGDPVRTPPDQEVKGTSTEFAFFALPPHGQRDGGQRKYRLMLSSAGNLVLYDASELADRFDLRGRATTGWAERLILRRVTSLSLSYYGATRSDPQKRWRQYWNGQAAAPDVVRIRVGFAVGDPRRWPDLYARPASNLDLVCDPEGRGTSCGKPGNS